MLAAESVLRLIRLSQPAAVLLPGVLQHVSGLAGATAVVEVLRRSLAPGSYLVVSHLAADAPPGDSLAAARHVYAQAGAPLTLRSREEIAGLLAGFELAAPGLVPPWQWHPRTAAPAGSRAGYAAVGRVP